MSVPKLRFKDEGGRDFPDWEMDRLGNICAITTGKLDANAMVPDGEYRFYTCAKEYYQIDKYAFDTDALLISGNGANVGYIHHYKGRFNAYQRTYVLDKFSQDIIYVKYFLDAHLYARIFTEKKEGNTPYIVMGTLTDMEIKLPSVTEQTKIADFLTAVDEKISQLTKKCDLLTQYKKGVMQKIFSQELRFKDDDGRDFPEWNEVLLGNISEISTGKSNRADSTSEGGAYTFFDRSQDIRTSNIYLFDCEAIIVAGEGQEFIPKHFIGKFDLHQRTYAVMNFHGNSGKFLYYHLDQYRHYFYSQAVGSTVKSLRLPMFEKMPVRLPHLDEQTKIANFLSAIDDKITATQSQLDAVKQYKQGLLQQMFV